MAAALRPGHVVVRAVTGHGARGAAVPFGPLGAFLEHATVRKGAVIATAACMHGDRHIPLQLLCAFNEFVWFSKCTGE